MKSLTTHLKSLSLNGKISEGEALKIASQFDSDLQEAIELLTKMKSQVGMYPGELIEAYLAKMKGTRFSSVEYNFEREPREQGL